jgi:hypothetical protein
LPEFVAAYARNTCRLAALLQALGVALGGNAGARLGARAADNPTSRPSLLRNGSQRDWRCRGLQGPVAAAPPNRAKISVTYMAS